jgi:hypothetical protein
MHNKATCQRRNLQHSEGVQAFLVGSTEYTRQQRSDCPLYQFFMDGIVGSQSDNRVKAVALSRATCFITVLVYLSFMKPQTLHKRLGVDLRCLLLFPIVLAQYHRK